MTAKKPDFILCIPLVCLLCLGLVMVRSASGIQSAERFNDPNYIFIKQLIAMAIGLVSLVILTHLPFDFFRRRLVLFGAVLIVTALLFGVRFQPAVNGAHRWYYFGSFGFQPSDLAKLVMIMVVAGYSAKTRDRPMSWIQRIVPILIVLTLFSGLILWQPDFGTTIILIFVVGVMLFLAGFPIGHLMAGGLLVLPIMVGLLWTQKYRVQRILDFRSNKEHYQITQAKIALGGGGLAGVGLGEGKQKLYFLPEPHNDFIFATLGEELGFVGTSFVILMYLLFFWRGAIVLTRVSSKYGQTLGAGILLLIMTQALLNISVTVALFPNKGLTLPFLSAGGTSLILCMAMCGILLNISRYQEIGNRKTR